MLLENDIIIRTLDALKAVFIQRTACRMIVAGEKYKNSSMRQGLFYFFCEIFQVSSQKSLH